MSDRAIHFCAVACWLGAAFALDLSLPFFAGFGLVSAAIAAATRHRQVWFIRAAASAIIIALLATTLGARAWADVQAVESGRWHGVARLANDPQPERGGVRVDLRIDGRRVQARAWGTSAGQLRARLLGESVVVDGRTRRIDAPTPWFASRGVQGTMTIDRVGRWTTGQPHFRFANAVRRTIESGAGSLDRSQRSLLTGFVYGDDRFQDALTADAFRAAGLTHLLAVSGQNVAFVLIIGGPILRRVDFRSRFALTLLALLVFATLTRFEPSVMRASLMAAVAALATVLGRSASSARVLSLAVIALILMHPLIVHSLAFQLSVAASLGILVIGPMLAPLIPGPRVFSEAVAVTSGAQLAVSPLLIAIFGGLPVASLPANIAAGPAAGPIMMWGLTAGTIAGVVDGPLPFVATAIHVPTRLLIGWVQVVAGLAAVVPLGELRRTHLVALAIAIAVLRWGRHHHRTVRQIAASAILIALLAPAIQLQIQPPRSFSVDDHTTVWRDHRFAVADLDPATDIEDLLASLRRHDVRRLDLVVTPGTRAAFSQLNAVEARVSVGEVWAPADHRIPGATTPPGGIELRVDGVTLVVVDDRGEFGLASDQPQALNGH